MVWNRMFGKKNKDDDFDPFQDLVLSKLKVGYLVDYDLKSWEVTEYNKYDWDNGFYSHEWELKSGNEVVYLECEDDDEPEWILAKKIPFKSLGPGLGKHIREKEDPPNQLKYNDATYHLEEGGGGYFCKGGGKERAEFLYWEFLDESGEQILTIEQWDENDFEASVGKYVEEYEFTNILPGSG